MDHNLENLQGAMLAVLWSRCNDPFSAPRAESRLMDSAIACGASFGEPDYVEWAAIKVADWLAST